MTPIEQLEKRLKEEQEVIVALLAMNKLDIAMDIVKIALLDFETALLEQNKLYIIVEEGNAKGIRLFRSKGMAEATLAELQQYSGGEKYSLLTEEMCD